MADYLARRQAGCPARDSVAGGTECVDERLLGAVREERRERGMSNAPCMALQLAALRLGQWQERQRRDGEAGAPCVQARRGRALPAAGALLPYHRERQKGTG